MNFWRNNMHNNKKINTEEVKKLLRTHLDNITIVQLFLLDIDNLDEQILESLCLPNVVISDIPKSITNKIHSNTENVALNHETYKKNVLNDIHKLNKQINKIEKVLGRLKEVDRFLITKKWIEDLTWNEVGREFTRKYYYISGDTMRKKVKNSLSKLAYFLS